MAQHLEVEEDGIEVEILHLEDEDGVQSSVAVLERITTPVGVFVLVATEDALADLLADPDEDADTVEVSAYRENPNGSLTPVEDPEEMAFLTAELEALGSLDDEGVEGVEGDKGDGEAGNTDGKGNAGDEVPGA